MAIYDFRSIEKKWQNHWQENKTFAVTEDPAIPPEKRLYCLEMFPYPSGSGLHVGHLKNYVPMDTFCRFKWMNGFNVLHPMGWDAFGQPAENEAIKKGRNPREMVPQLASVYKRTLELVGCTYDWDREINSSTPDYYKWTQWIFLLLHKRGLAYRNFAPINWCGSCKTGLANEEVKEGRCWRCDNLVEKKPMPQWFFKITDYADRLLNDLDALDWTEGMKEMQRNWIGRSAGAEVDFKIEATNEAIRVFTTRPDTLFGATFLVLAPEHPLVAKISSAECAENVAAYVKKSQNETEIDRMNADRVKTGVFTGAYAINPVNDAKIPIWIADYVLMGYGTGAIMAVPAHDSRDFEFAKKYQIPIVQVVSTDGSSKTDLTEPLTEEGVAVNSGQFSGLKTPEFKLAITRWLEEKGFGNSSVNYRLRDWLISRQRYWGAPIPIVHCPHCGEVPVPEKDLPVMLPDVENYQPTGTGESPLASIPSFVNTKCPLCGKDAKRETDTMGGYACSSWYFLRFANSQNSHAFASQESLNYWLPVNVYAGGIEHARSHLLYSRFWTKVLFDAGHINFQEPFLTLRNQGSLLAYTPGRKPRAQESGADDDTSESVVDWIVLKPEERDSFPKDQVVWRWARMSKSKGNVVTPDDMAQKYGADSLRVYMMFVAPFEDNVMWNEEGIAGSARFVQRVWRWINAAAPHYDPHWRNNKTEFTSEDRKVRRKLHQSIQKIETDLNGFQFNTPLAMLMELTNEIYAYAPLATEEKIQDGKNTWVLSELMESLVLLMAPFAPHMCEELWQMLGHKSLVAKASWPKCDIAATAVDSVTVVFQVNGKLRGQAEVAPNTPQDDLLKIALENDRVKPLTDGKTIVKTIFVPNKIVNIVVK